MKGLNSCVATKGHLNNFLSTTMDEAVSTLPYSDSWWGDSVLKFSQMCRRQIFSNNIVVRNRKPLQPCNLPETAMETYIV